MLFSIALHLPDLDKQEITIFRIPEVRCKFCVVFHRLIVPCRTKPILRYMILVLAVSFNDGGFCILCILPMTAVSINTGMRHYYGKER